MLIIKLRYVMRRISPQRILLHLRETNRQPFCFHCLAAEISVANWCHRRKHNNPDIMANRFRGGDDDDAG